MAGVPMDQREGWIWFDGEFKPWKDAKIHVLTHGLHYASSVFEGERAYGGEIFKSREHTERLIRSGKTLDFTIPWSVEPTPLPSSEVRFTDPEEAQEASYLAASVRMASLRLRSGVAMDPC